MKNISAFLLTLSLSAVAFASDYETIKNQMSDVNVGQVIDPSALKGFYDGICHASSTYSAPEGLYWNSFVDTHGGKKDLAMTTMQTHSGVGLPDHLEFLLKPTLKAWKFMSDVVSVGANGTDNNLGNVGTGPDFRYVYKSELQGTTFTMTIGREQICSTGTDRSFCNPPVLRSCTYGSNSKGERVYEGCDRANDKTVFKKLSDDTLISVRTADSVGTRSNNYSFYLPAIETYCEWKK